MSRIATRFEALKSTGKTALIPYITAGDSDPSITVPLMHDMVQAGADLIELGIPFSDPMADGPVIQLACERALEHNTSLHDALNMVAEFRQNDQDTPIILMGYLNPIETMGYETFAQAAKEVGVDGALTVDLPPEEGEEAIALFKQYGIDPIFLVAPTSSAERINRICKQGSGFVYYVSLKGVTGANTLDVDAVAQKLGAIRNVTDMPVGVGFGVKDAQTAAHIAQVADAVVVGSAIVRKIEQGQGDFGKITDDICTLLSSMREAIDGNSISETV